MPRQRFLPPEERQMFKAEVIYRLEGTNGFPKTVSKTIRLKKNQESDPAARDDDPAGAFRHVRFCTAKNTPQPLPVMPDVFANWSPTASSSRSTPESCRNLKPGDYVRYISQSTHLHRFATAASARRSCPMPPRPSSAQMANGSCTGRSAKTMVFARPSCND